MDLNDPFHRVARRRQAAYRSVAAQLHEAIGEDRAALVALIERARRTAWQLALGLVAIAVALAWLAPAARWPALVTCGLLLVWLATSYLQTRAHMKAYLQHLDNGAGKDPGSDDSPSGDPS